MTPELMLLAQSLAYSIDLINDNYSSLLQTQPVPFISAAYLDPYWAYVNVLSMVALSAAYHLPFKTSAY